MADFILYTFNVVAIFPSHMESYWILYTYNTKSESIVLGFGFIVQESLN